MPTYLLINESTDPAFNLALEEHALTAMDIDLIMLWRNEKAVIIGRNQNAAEEIDSDFVRENNIAVIRRQSGGGAVFHDLGNVNFTVINAAAEGDFSNYEKFTAPIVDFLRGMGVGARLEGRNDLVIGGMKFSGNAQAMRNGRIMHHGTILYNADFGNLAKALRPRGAKIESKGIKSVRSRVTNVAAHLESPPPVGEFFASLAGYFRQSVAGLLPYELSQADIAATKKLVAEKYGSWEWNFGSSPAYNYEKARKFPFGLVELRLQVENGVIAGCRIFGDFFGLRELGPLEEALCGARHDRLSVESALAALPIGEFIQGAAAADLLELF